MYIPVIVVGCVLLVLFLYYYSEYRKNDPHVYRKAMLYFIVWLIWGFGVFLITRSNQEGAKEAAYNRGYEHGYEDGLKDGYKEGEKDMIDIAHEAGYKEGYQEGVANATFLNVNPEVKYPHSQYEWENTAIILLDYSDAHYHLDARCDWLPEHGNPDALVVSEYEAVERNFTPCPNCVKTHF